MMTMARLSAALITRNSDRRPIGPIGQIGQSPAQFMAQGLSRLVGPVAEASLAKTSKANQPPRASKRHDEEKAKRAQKTLRLSARVNQDLIALAEDKGVSQQSLMERAVREMVTRRSTHPAQKVSGWAANDAIGARRTKP